MDCEVGGHGEYAHHGVVAWYDHVGGAVAECTRIGGVYFHLLIVLGIIRGGIIGRTHLHLLVTL